MGEALPLGTALKQRHQPGLVPGGAWRVAQGAEVSPQEWWREMFKVFVHGTSASGLIELPYPPISAGESPQLFHSPRLTGSAPLFRAAWPTPDVARSLQPGPPARQDHALEKPNRPAKQARDHVAAPARHAIPVPGEPAAPEPVRVRHRPHRRDPAAHPRLVAGCHLRAAAPTPPRDRVRRVQRPAAPATGYENARQARC